jgi:hypothetical protein
VRDPERGAATAATSECSCSAPKAQGGQAARPRARPRPDPGPGSAGARRARGRGRQHEPAGGILGATIKLASLPAAFAVYRAHDISPDLASALLDMNSAAFVSTLTPRPCCSAPPAPSCSEPGADARTATSRSPPPVGAREHPELHLRRPAHVHAHVCLDHRHQRVATPPWRAHRGRRRSRRAGHRLTPLARCAFARTVTLSGCAAWREHSRECSLRWMRSCPRPIHTHSLRTTSRSADRDRCFLTKPAVWRSQVPRISL